MTTPRRTIDQIFQSHNLWVDSVGTKGEQAVLAGFDLSSIAFQGHNLRYADFRGAKLRDTSFIACDLRGAKFDSSSLNVISFFRSKWLSTDIPWHTCNERFGEARIYQKKLRWAQKAIESGK